MFSSLTFYIFKGQWRKIHGLEACSEDALENHIQLWHTFYNLQHHLTDSQKPAETPDSK